MGTGIRKEGFPADTSLVPTPVALSGGLSLQVDEDAFDPSFERLIRSTPPLPTPGVNGTAHASVRLIEDFGASATTMRLDFAKGATARAANFAFLGGVGGGTFVIDVFAADGALLGTVEPGTLADASGAGSGFAGFTTTAGDIADHLVCAMPSGGATNSEAFAMVDRVAVAVPAAVPGPGTPWLVLGGSLVPGARERRG